MPRHSHSRRHNKKHRQRFNPGKPNSLASQRIHNVYGESIGRPNEKRVLEIANTKVKEILREDAQRGRIEEVDYVAEPTAPFSLEDREGKDIKITFIKPDRLSGRLIPLQIKSSREGARTFRERGEEIPVITVGINKDPGRDRERIARCLAGMIRQELKKDEPVEASA